MPQQVGAGGFLNDASFLCKTSVGGSFVEAGFPGFFKDFAGEDSRKEVCGFASGPERGHFLLPA